MGLDMYAIAVKGKVNSEVDFNTNNIKFEKNVHYWRKHPNLHGWMKKLYYKKGGKDDSFNGSNVVLTESDLDSLEQDIINETLPHTHGYFFGESQGNEKEDDLAFISKARKLIKEGKIIFYSSSW